jgi:glutathione S-transferase
LFLKKGKFIDMNEKKEFTLYYWAGLPGRGEFVRLALEFAGAEYWDICRDPHNQEDPYQPILRKLESPEVFPPVFAPPILEHKGKYIAQTANVLDYLANIFPIGGSDAESRRATLQVQLTIADFVTEIHNTHHPLSASLYYEDQIQEAKKASEVFLNTRILKWMKFWNSMVQSSQGDFLLGREILYVDLSFFQVLGGLNYAFPRFMSGLQKEFPNLFRLFERISQNSKLKSYLESDRRLFYNRTGLFRHYPELDQDFSLHKE